MYKVKQNLLSLSMSNWRKAAVVRLSKVLTFPWQLFILTDLQQLRIVDKQANYK